MWARMFRVSAAGSDTATMPGVYSADNATVVFRPMFSLDREREYTIRFDPRRLPVPRQGAAVARVVSLPGDPATPAAATVARVLPAGGPIPENQLRFYIEFSAPMSRNVPGTARLIDDSGNEIKRAFLTGNETGWNRERTRYTLLLDPARTRSGARATGRSLSAGRAYALVIDSSWKDANGRSLVRPFRYEFRAGPAINGPIVLADWSVRPARGATREPLIVTFPRQLDRASLEGSLEVRTAHGDPVAGRVALTPGDREWQFIPNAPWKPEVYQLAVAPTIEDLAGNRIGRVFEPRDIKHVAAWGSSDVQILPFSIR
jgi:hypothetical protein